MRRHDWPEQLAEYLDACRDAAFVWGEHDCCRFAAKAVLAMTGRDYMFDYTYRGELGARRLIQRAGSLDVLLRRALGDPLPSVAQAGRGDVVLAELELGPTVGICVGPLCAFAREPAGVTFRSLRAAQHAWRIC